jgi:hypothetical protein
MYFAIIAKFLNDLFGFMSCEGFLDDGKRISGESSAVVFEWHTTR